MPENKFLWRAIVARIAKPIYLVAQNMPSAHAHASNHPEVEPEDVLHMQRVDSWDDQQNMTVVLWPQPPPPPEPEQPEP